MTSAPSPAPERRGVEFLLYGAYGFTGALIAEEAVRRGHRPVLAGRSAERLAPLAERLGLGAVAVGLDEPRALARALGELPAVVNAAGPFVRTGPPMLRACLDARASYLDITGEIPAFERTFSHDAEARARGVTLLSGVGFDVVPTDCMARWLADRLPGATELELAIASTGGGLSAGTAKTMLEMIPSGNRIRREGALVEVPFGGARRVRFLDRERSVLTIPWGDLSTAWRTTGIPNITTYMAFPARQARLLGLAAPHAGRLLAVGPLRRAAQAIVERLVRGPDARHRATGRSHVWGRAAGPKGAEVQGWIETAESYRFTAVSAVRCLERVLAERPPGAVTPAGALGADLVLEIEGSRRVEALPT